MPQRETPTARPALAWSPLLPQSRVSERCLADSHVARRAYRRATSALESPKGHLPMSVVLGSWKVIPTARVAGNPRWFCRVLPEPYHMVDGPTTRRRTALRRASAGG